MTSGGPVTGAESADLVVLAAAGHRDRAARAALLVPRRERQAGRRLMMHAFIDGTAIFTDERVHAYRGGR